MSTYENIGLSFVTVKRAYVFAPLFRILIFGTLWPVCDMTPASNTPIENRALVQAVSPDSEKYAVSESQPGYSHEPSSTVASSL